MIALAVAFMTVLTLVVAGIVFFTFAANLSSMSQSGVQAQKLEVNQEDTPFLVVPGKEETLIYYDAKTPARIAGEYYSHVMANEGHTVAICVKNEESITVGLYLFTGKETLLIDDEVEGFELACSGQALVYVTDYDDSTHLSTLHYYDVKTQKSKVLSDTAVTQKLGVVLSPDGDSVGFAQDGKFDENNTLSSFTGAVSINGAAPATLGENNIPVAVSNRGEYIYYTNYDSREIWDHDLFVKSKTETIELGTIDQDSRVYLNQDNTEICFGSFSNASFSRDGQKARSIGRGELKDIIFPEYTDLYPAGMEGQYVTAMVPTLMDKIFILDDFGDSISLLGSNFSYKAFAEDLSPKTKEDVRVFANSASMAYVSDEDVIMMYDDVFNMFAMPKKVKYTGSILKVICRDPSAIFILDEENTLFSVIDGAVAVQVATDVVGSSVRFLPGTDSVYYQTGNSDQEEKTEGKPLWVTSTSIPGKSDKIADEVVAFEASAYGVVYYVCKDPSQSNSYTAICDAFYAKDGRDFKSISKTAIVQYDRNPF